MVRDLIFPLPPQPPAPPSRPSAPALPPTSAAARDNAARWCTGADPVVSIILVNQKSALATAHHIHHIWLNTTGMTYEILLADNAGATEDRSLLRGLGDGVRLIEVGTDRHIGETHNIAVEAARAPFVCFLSHRAFVRSGWLTALCKPLQDHEGVSATGPKLLRPDGRLHEAGRRIEVEGFATPIGRFADPMDRTFNQPRDVDCLSTECLLVRRADFVAARGFDLAYEPAGYEDADLGFKLRENGGAVRYCPDASAVCFEAAMPSDSPEAARQKSLSDLNRAKFLARWKARLQGTAPAKPKPRRAATVPGAARSRPRLPRAAIFTPFLLTPGGGERVILTLASVLSATHEVTIVTSHPYSRMRLLTLGQEFAIDLSACSLMTGARFRQAPQPDLFVLLGNHLFPSEPPRGVRNWYLCQFPFPMDAGTAAASRANLPGYEMFLAYSPYARTYIAHGFGAEDLSGPHCEILFPPVMAQPGNAKAKKRMVLSVGRFMSGGHTKRHDVLIDAFRVLHARCGGDIELHLAGSSFPIPDDMDYLTGLMAASADLPVKFHVNATPDTLQELYRDAMFYWHATGYGLQPDEAPERAEHFGMTIVEAMSAGCVPLTFASGGPCDIIAEGRTGYLFRSLDDLVNRTAALLEPDAQPLRQALGRAATDAAEEYSLDRFAFRFGQLLDGPYLDSADVQAAQAS